MLGSECVILSIEDANNLIYYLGYRRQTKEAIKKMQDKGILNVYNELVEDVRKYDEKWD